MENNDKITSENYDDLIEEFLKEEEKRDNFLIEEYEEILEYENYMKNITNFMDEKNLLKNSVLNGT